MGQNKIPSPWQNYWGWTREQYKPGICSTPLSERDCGISVHRACGNAFVERSTKQHAESSIKPGHMKGCIDPTRNFPGNPGNCIFSKCLTYLQQLGRLTLQKVKLFKMSLHAKKEGCGASPQGQPFPWSRKGQESAFTLLWAF